MKLQALEGVQVALLPRPTAARRGWGVPSPRAQGRPEGTGKGMGTWPGAENRWAPRAQAMIVQLQLTLHPMGQDSQALQSLQQ